MKTVRPSMFYSQCNDDKTIVNVCQPILSTAGTFSYKIITFLVAILNCLTLNIFTIKMSLSFSKIFLTKNECICDQLEETITICIESIYS